MSVVTAAVQLKSAATQFVSTAFASDGATKITQAAAGTSIALGGMTLSQWQSVVAIIGIVAGTVVSLFTGYINWKHKTKQIEAMERDKEGA